MSNPFDGSKAEEVTDELRRVPQVEAVPNRDGETEQLGATAVTHRFVEAPGDSETVRWHVVEAGDTGAPAVVFLRCARLVVAMALCPERAGR